MKTFFRLAAPVAAPALALIAALAAPVAFAKEAPTDPTVQARVAVMATIGKNTKVLGDMAGGKAPFDAAAAASAKEAILAATTEIAPKFEPQASDPNSEAKPEIWTNWADFVSKAEAAKTAATALDASSLDTVKAGMGALGGACKACHTDYRL